MSQSQTETRTHVTITIPKSAAEFGIDRPSIRQIVLAGIFNGSTNLEMGQLIHRYHPGSAPTTSAKKMSKHISWYRSRCKQVGTAEHKALQGMLALQAPAAPTVPVTTMPPVAPQPVVTAVIEPVVTGKTAEELAAEIDQRLNAA